MNNEIPMKKVNGYENYFITNDGRVWNSVKKKWLNPYSDGKYLAIGLHKNRKRVIYRIHRLVAEAFVPNPNNLDLVIHKNKNKTDNLHTNLEWANLVCVSDEDIETLKGENRLVYSVWHIGSK